MSSLDSSSNHYEEFRARQIRFVGEQDGRPERLLKESLSGLFRSDGTIDKAYLAKIDYADGGKVGVVLGLLTQFGPNQSLVVQVASAFKSIFNEKEHLDIMFMTDTQNAQLSAVCRPFFEQYKG
jgi:SseB protein C-terminal domain